MKKVFLDCGSNIGNSVDLFREVFPNANDYEIFCFEASPNFKKFYKDKGVNFIQKAVWVNECKLRLYTGKKTHSESSSIIKEKFSGGLSQSRFIEVEALDFSNWIRSNLNISDYIILKLDIEGSEYKVLEKMIADGTITYINELFIEWHWYKMNMPKEEHDKIVANVNCYLQPKNWGAKERIVEGIL